jgi:hypothetical protein
MTLYQELRERGARDGRELVEVEPTGERAMRPGRSRFDSKSSPRRTASRPRRWARRRWESSAEAAPATAKRLRAGPGAIPSTT